MLLRYAKSNIILSRSNFTIFIKIFHKHTLRDWFYDTNFFNVSTIGLIYCSSSTLVQPKLDIALTLDSILQPILIFQYDSWLTLNLLSYTLQYKWKKQKKNIKQCVLTLLNLFTHLWFRHQNTSSSYFTLYRLGSK